MEGAATGYLALGWNNVSQTVSICDIDIHRIYSHGKTVYDVYNICVHIYIWDFCYFYVHVSLYTTL